jgi:hypothetical protein
MGELLRTNFRPETHAPLTDGSLALAMHRQYSIPDNNVVLFKAQTKSTFPRPREVVASGGFSVEYSKKIDEQSLYNDIVSYLGEYRFSLGRFDYPLRFVQDDSGTRIIDPVSGESMQAKTKRAIWEKRIRGESSTREEADDEGIGNLTTSIATAKTGDAIWIGSLPGRPEDGFGKYAFIYLGKVLRTIQTQKGVEKEIAMSAIRVENPTLESFNQAYADLAGQSLNATSPESFLRNPVVVSGKTKEQLEREIRGKFTVNGGEDEKEWFNGAIADLKPAIADFMYLVRHGGTQEEKLEAFYTIEKHADYLKKLKKLGGIRNIREQPRLIELQAVYKNVKLENHAGSCPITNQSGNVFESSYGSLNKALFSESKDNKKWFHCPQCGYEAHGPVGNTCPACGLTKEDYAEDSGEEMCD